MTYMTSYMAGVVVVAAAVSAMLVVLAMLVTPLLLGAGPIGRACQRRDEHSKASVG